MWQGHAGLIQLQLGRHSPQGIPLCSNTKPSKLTLLCPVTGFPAASFLHGLHWHMRHPCHCVVVTFEGALPKHLDAEVDVMNVSQYQILTRVDEPAFSLLPESTFGSTWMKLAHMSTGDDKQSEQPPSVCWGKPHCTAYPYLCSSKMRCTRKAEADMTQPRSAKLAQAGNGRSAEQNQGRVSSDDPSSPPPAPYMPSDQRPTCKLRSRQLRSIMSVGLPARCLAWR